VGLQYGLYRLMELSGKRFFSYTDTYTPPKSIAVLPSNGYKETHAPSDQMKVRGFSPHLYHPVPLSFAFHEPGAEHLQMVKNYIDWCVANGQNYVLWPLLEHDQANPVLPIAKGNKNYDAWVPHARAIVEYAHQRGVQMSIKPAFANYVSSNVYAINPLTATGQSMKLNKAWKKVTEAKAEVTAAESKLAKLPLTANRLVRDRAVRALSATKLEVESTQREYQKQLETIGSADRVRIEQLIDRLMVVPWDEITWNLGTSEFTPTNDDLTIGWMNDAADILKKKYPGVRTAARSHVPSHPHSEKYDESYFNLVRFTDPAVGALIHTTHAYGLTDKAPVYGNADFTHKLEMLAHATPERMDIFYPETSYWVAHDVSVPLFMPVYMMNRKHDVEIVKAVKDLDGHVGFTTAWEWGYWLNDYTLARMQSHPEESLTEILDAAFAPLGPARTPMVDLLSECMEFQKEYLLDKNLIRHLQGFDALTDFGVFANQNPLLNKVLKGTNSTPIRLRPSDIMKMNATELEAFRTGDMADLVKVEQTFKSYADRADALRAQVPAAAEKYQDEMADGLRINALRAKQVRAALEATVLARKAELTRVDAYRTRGEALLNEARVATQAAMAQIADREKDYREAAEYNTAKGDSLTLWGDRYLTPVHTAKYWTNTLKEIEELYQRQSQKNALRRP
jgi:hypothetical protein